jgi:S-adenosylhomocysteine hydrolase
VRGESERRVATLGFFVPGDVSEIFKDDADALDAAREAVRLRRIGAVLTDAGIVMAATGLARALFQRDFDKLSGALTIAGAGSLGVSIPVQFAADGYLSRAVWLYNRRYSR